MAPLRRGNRVGYAVDARHRRHRRSRGVAPPLDVVVALAVAVAGPMPMENEAA